MGTVVFILIFVVLWAWIEIVRSKQTFREQMAALRQRIWTLEREVERLSRPAPADTASHPREATPERPAHATPPPIPVAPTVSSTVEPEVPPVHIASPAPAFMQATPPPPPTAPPPPPPAQPRGARDWEAIIGGDLLNKVGALLLVIGIMSFLAYYGTKMGPAGRAGCALLVSLSLLGTGVWLERKETYRTFARGLIGAGWAALYATAYAIYAVPAARVIENAFVGSCLVLLVAGGMIGHSLRYRSQAVTAVAFFSAFAALAVTPSAPFAVISLIPLAAAVLYLAQRFDWYHMALMGVFATYGACAWHGSSGAPLVQTETLFLFYWALFEIFDLMRFGRRIGGWAVELVFPLNAAGFLTLSYVSWINKSPSTVWLLSGIAATIYLVSTLWRLKIELDRGAAENQDLAARVRSGTYEAPLVLGAFLTATAIVQKLTGMWMSTGLALEAQVLFTVGIRFRVRFLRALSAAGFMVSLAYLADSSTHGLGAGQVNVLGHMTHTWVIIALFHALLFYVDRAMSESKSIIGTGFSWAASVLVSLALLEELPERFVGTGWLILAAILFEFGLHKKLLEFRLQSYVMALGGGLASASIYKAEAAWPWFPLAFGTAFFLAATWRAALIEKSDGEGREWILVGWSCSAWTGLFATVLIVKEVPDQYQGAALWGLALAMLELGLQRLPARLRVISYPVAALGALVTLGEASSKVAKYAAPQIWAPYFAAATAACIMSGRLTLAAPDAVSRVERSEVRSGLSAIGLVFGMIAFWMVTPDEFLPAVWAALGLAVLEAGRALEVLAYRLEAQAIAVYSAISAFVLTLPDGQNHRILAIAMLIAVHAGFRFRSAGGTGMESKLPLVHEGASSILAAALLFQEVSGGLLTMAWGMEALVLLGIGFVCRERPLRLNGLGLFLICVLKLFLYDLRNLETPYRILSFIALGLILLGVSWIYTRFREQLQKLL